MRKSIKLTAVIAAALVIALAISCSSSPAHEHSLKYEHDANGHWQVCESCGYSTKESAYEAHVYGKFDYSVEGKRTQTCTVCGNSVTETVKSAAAKDVDTLLAAIENTDVDVIYFTEDITAYSLNYNGNEETCSYETKLTLTGEKEFDLQGHAFTFKDRVYLQNANIVMRDGKVAFEIAESGKKWNTQAYGGYKDAIYQTSLARAIYMEGNSALGFMNVDFKSDGSGILVRQNTKNQAIALENSTFTVDGLYGISTNASKADANPSDNILISVIGSNIKVNNNYESTDERYGDNAAILFNVGGQVIIKDSTIEADGHGVILRSGNTTKEVFAHCISNTTIKVSGKNKIADDYTSTTWDTGTGVPLAGLLIGNNNASYPWGCNARLKNVTIEAPEKNEADKKVYSAYVYQLSADYPVDVVYESSKISFNDNMNGAACKSGSVNPDNYSMPITLKEAGLV